MGTPRWHARPGKRRRPLDVAAGVILVVVLPLTACDSGLPGSEPPDAEPPQIGLDPETEPVPADGLGVRVLSNRADLLSGGDALIEITLPEQEAVPPGLTVTVGRRDVTRAFAIRPDGRLLGTVNKLKRGRNVLTVRAPGIAGARLRLTNHPIGGPVFAGDQVQPWRCATQANGLGPPRDAQCNTRPVHQLLYRSAETDEFLPYDPEDPPPAAEIATTTTDQDHSVPYIVRRERGVIDRGIYDIAVLYEPGAPWKPWAPQPGWNRKVLWTFGGSCQPYHAQVPPEGRPDNPPSPGVLIDRALSRGYAVASSAMNVLGGNCNTVVSAEALMMVKEHLIETYGQVRYTVGMGGSGGSIGALQVADAYPGLLDGVIARSTFVDLLSTVAENFDCRLLVRYFNTSAAGWSDAARLAAEGHTSRSTCTSWVGGFAFPAMFGDPTVGCTAPLRSFDERDAAGVRRPGFEASFVYDPVTNPDGVRCTIFDYMDQIFGRRADGIARRPYDNVGVQYGLRGLLDGVIPAEQFVDLNAGIGGLDLDYRFVPSRVGADRRALRAAYRSGQVLSGGALAQVPIVDGSYEPSDGKIHTASHSWRLRERLLAATGNADNHVIRQEAGDGPMFRLMDTWLSRMAADREPGSRPERVVRNRPRKAVDRGSYGATNPRIAAGAPLRDDVLKCRLTPLDRGGYPGVSFTDAQWNRLQRTFPDGVCDWTQPGVGQTPTVPWATYARRGIKPLGDPPVARPLPPRG